MAKRPKEPGHYDDLRAKSGWYAAAWRDHRGLSLQDMADAMGSSRGQISDLETGAKTRYNRDWLERFCTALDVAAGDLIDTNPFKEDARFAAVRRAFPQLDQNDLAMLVDFADTIERRRA